MTQKFIARHFSCSKWKGQQRPLCGSIAGYFNIVSVYLWLLIFSLTVFFSSPLSTTALPSYSCTSFPTNEYQALQSLYDSTAGNTLWVWQQNVTRYGIPWNFTVTQSSSPHNPCLEHWQYLTCTTVNTVCHIQTLVLNGKGLNGTLPDTFGNQFSEMTLLQITINFDLIGSLPSALFLRNTSSGSSGSGMQKLVTLSLYSNGFTGTIPTLPQNPNNTLSLIPYPVMQSLQLYDNFLTGSIPAWFSNYTSLQTFSLYGNLLSQTLPESFGTWKYVQNFYVSNNLLTGSIPSSYQQWKTIRVIKLDVNAFTSGGSSSSSGNSLFSIIPFWSKTLTTVTAKYNELTGTMPPTSFTGLTLVTMLDFGFNYLSGELPSSLMDLTSVKTLSFRVNLLSGSIAMLTTTSTTTSSLWPKLNYLYLYTNQFTGTILTKGLCNLPKLLDLDIHENYFSGTLPSQCGTGSTPSTLTTLPLQYLYIHDNHFTGSIPSLLLSQMHNAKSFLIAYNMFTGTLPVNIGKNLINAQKIEIDSNMLNGSLPASLCQLVNTTYLLLDTNQFSGTIPDCWYHMHNLQYFYLFDNNRLSGTLPSSMGNVTKLQHFRISNASIEGTIPSTYKYLTQLIEFIADENHLSGTLAPEVVCAWKQIQFLNVCKNGKMSGTIPTCMKESGKNLLDFELSNNQFSGTIPWSSIVQYWTSLIIFVVDTNRFTGTLPDEASLYSPLQSLRYLWVETNFLTGTIPSNLSQLSNLTYLFLNENLFTGTLSTTLSKLNHTLTYLEVNNNELTGTLPLVPLTLPKLQFLSLSVNQFTGTINELFLTLPSIQYLIIGLNYLTGTLPDSIAWTINPTVNTNESEMMNEKVFPIPWIGMKVFAINANYLTGSLPSFFPYLIQMENINISSNLLTGPLFPFLTLSLHVSDNSGSNGINGGINSSDGIQHWKDLQVFSCFSNQFSSSIPSNTFTSLAQLSVLLLRDNRFTGSLTNGFVNVSLQHALATVDISNNMFTGSLPDELFQLTSLQTLAAVKNCFTGSLPVDEVLCNGNAHWTLQTLVLDGLHGASIHCPRKSSSSSSSWLLQTSFDSVKIGGSISSCLFTNLPVLQTLHLSGNGIKGTLPSDLTTISASLTNLSLSHNLLSGTIPIVIQEHPWTNLDLSFNKLSGTLNEKIYSFDPVVLSTTTNATTPSLSLDINRLSGSIPSSLYYAKSIDILQGNIFSCSMEEENDRIVGSSQHENSVPIHDKSQGSYSCGSNSTNTVIYIWIGLVLFPMICVAMFVWRSLKEKSTIQTEKEHIGIEESSSGSSGKCCGWNSWISRNVMTWQSQYAMTMMTSSSVLLPIDTLDDTSTTTTTLSVSIAEIVALMHVFVEIRQWLIALTVIIMVVLLPLYPLLAVHYSTHSYEYAWSISVAFLSGIVPTVIPMLCILSLVTLLYMRALRGKHRLNIRFLFDKLKTSKKTNEASKDDNEVKASNDEAKDVVVQERVALISTDGLVVPHTWWWYIKLNFVLLLNLVIVLTVNMSYVYALSTDISSSAKQWIALFVSFYKVVWNRVLFEIFQASHLFSSKSSSSFSLYGMFGRYMTWMSLFNNILAPCIAIAFVSPNCFYYAIWTSAPPVNTSYDVTLCYLSFQGNASSFDCNDLHKVTFSTTFIPPYTYDYQCSASLLLSFAEVFVIRFIMTSLGPIVLALIVDGLRYGILYLSKKRSQTPGTQEDKFLNWLQLRLSSIIIPPLLRPMSVQDDIVPGREEVPSITATTTTPKHIIRADIRIIGFITDIAILLTFGTIFPPIALIGTITVIIQTMSLQCWIGRILYLYQHEGKLLCQRYLKEWIMKMNEECHGASALMRTSLLSLSILIVIVWSLFLFDTLGDSKGVDAGVTVVIVMILFPMMLEGVDRLYDWKYKHNSNDKVVIEKVDDQIQVVEMQRLSVYPVVTTESMIANPMTNTNTDS